ncbi:hypothetical protein SDC9_82360 [bioreactor metagenome]|uniref:Uncharacterized protein n=1 Tax=bioreactor metagenome TaxID=1076179 RepID=A0A644Z4H9_9ZZZZ
MIISNRRSINDVRQWEGRRKGRLRALYSSSGALCGAYRPLRVYNGVLRSGRRPCERACREPVAAFATIIIPLPRGNNLKEVNSLILSKCTKYNRNTQVPIVGTHLFATAIYTPCFVLSTERAIDKLACSLTNLYTRFCLYNGRYLVWF